MNPQKVVISEELEQTLTEAVSACEHDRTFILVDETTERCCLPLFSGMACVQGATTIVIGATDTHKTLESLAHVWEELGKGGATRHSLLINIGGGMVTDLGGFAASTFKRGINYINIPTTLLAMVDASVGGKTGINFRGLKNEVGVFSNASTVILDTIFLKTLDAENICSGYAEMLKHGLISNNQMWAELINFKLESPDLSMLKQMVADSVAVKQRIVTEDPLEQGIRKALNLGHTIGHAFESFALQGSLSPLTPLTWLCCCLRTRLRALSQRHEDWVPHRQDAPDRQLHQGALRENGHHLRRLSHPTGADDPRQEECGGHHQLHPLRWHWRYSYQPDRHERGDIRGTRLLP